MQLLAEAPSTSVFVLISYRFRLPHTPYLIVGGPEGCPLSQRTRRRTISTSWPLSCSVELYREIVCTVLYISKVNIINYIAVDIMSSASLTNSYAQNRSFRTNMLTFFLKMIRISTKIFNIHKKLITCDDVFLEI